MANTSHSSNSRSALDAESLAKQLGHAARCGDGWTARCPVHDDHQPSLTLHDGEDGKVLVHYQKGCSQDAVISTSRSNCRKVRNVIETATAQPLHREAVCTDPEDAKAAYRWGAKAASLVEY